MKRSVRSESAGSQTTVARIGLVMAGLAVLTLTPSFAMAYFRAYGYGSGEAPTPWLEALEPPAWLAGSSRVSTYNNLGVAYGLALAVVVVATARLVAVRSEKGAGEVRGWALVLGGLGAVATGSLLEYGIPEDVLNSGFGFVLELTGFVAIVIGTVSLGVAARRDLGVGRLRSLAIAAAGPVVIVAGAAAVGHLPSGPASAVVLVVMITALTGSPGARPARLIRSVR